MFKITVVQKKFNTLGVKSRRNFFLGGFLMVNAIMRFTGLFFMEAVNGDQWHYTKV